MKILVKLPPDRETEGVLVVMDDAGVPIFGPVRCRGEADDAEERRHGTADDETTHVFGDHPYGVSRIGQVVQDPSPAHSYGPFFIGLRPVSGDAREGWQQGRRGLGIHGGDLGPGSTLRATYGCLRADNETMEHLAKLVTAERRAGREVVYSCEPLVP